MIKKCFTFGLTGIPYAEPPVGQHRFEPPTTQTPWTGVKHFVNFAAVCPQVLPNTEEEIDVTRHEYLKRLLPYLENQSEDCLYLNIYAPHQNNSEYRIFFLFLRKVA